VILVDTSVWIDHFRKRDAALGEALQDGEVLTHSFVIGELACGNLGNRREILSLLDALPRAREATHEEVMALVDRRRLMGKGLGYIDVHLLASSLLTPDATLWTRDRRLATAASALR
jgi:predicted nucleic acid-binding protein